ncbi:MAG: Na+/H+ antiporter subunit E [Lachnospiraceae bacterium]
MYFAFLMLWIIFNGRFTIEILLFGIVIAAMFYCFICKFMGYKMETDLKILKNLFPGIHYIFVLIFEVILANIAVVRLVLTPRIEIKPVLVRFKTDLKSDQAKAVLANSITLTPGTITCDLEPDGTFLVHCLDRQMAVGMDDSKFVQLLRRMEGVMK